MESRKALLARLLLLASINLSFVASVHAAFSLTDLRVNYQTEPLGTDVERPLFSWKMESSDDERGLQQTAYQLIVKDETGQEVWNTGKVTSGVSLAIPYAGAPLQATTRYDWTVTVWNQDQETASSRSWFETGLMNPDPNLTAWDGATWIGGGDEDMVLASHYLSVFKIHYKLQLDSASQSTKAAFVLGANDQRLMDKDLNLKKMQVGENESYIALELDIAELAKGGTAKLNVYRVGYAPEDNPSRPYKSYDIPKRLIDSNNRYRAHQFYVESVFGLMNVFLDGQQEENKLNANDVKDPFGRNGFLINPYGPGGDYIGFPMVADIGFKVGAGQRARFSRLEVRNYRQPSNLLFSEDLSTYRGIFATAKEGFRVTDQGYELMGGSDGLLITADPSRNAAPMLRTEFTLENKTIKKARVYATARGIYELYLNGRRVGNDYFNPGLTQYDNTHLYQTYDVTELLRAGSDNALGAWLSEGWWSGNITFTGANWNFFGDRQSLLTKLVVTYDDGTTTVVTSRPDRWRLFTDGPIRYGSFFQGEIYDATKEAAVEGWATAGYDASQWKPAVAVPLEGTSVTGTFPTPFGPPIELYYDDQQIRGQIGENVSIVETRSAQTVTEVRPGVFVYDMGQNMVGFPHIRLADGQRGDTIRLRYAEVLYPALAEYGDNTGMVMMENIRAALTQDIYIRKGGAEVIQPRFTFHGYRYLEITGIDKALPLDAVTTKVLSSVAELASHYETSNPLVNRLWRNVTWSLRGNFLSIPTDTPARNERMGWNGDINVFSRAATWLANVNQFFKRHLLAMRDMQADNGRFSDVAPVGNGFGGTLWGSAGIIVAWEAYQQYGDLNLLEQHYDAMKDYVDFLASKQDANGVLIEGPLGDWLSPENLKNDDTMLWTAYQIRNLDIMRQVADILGRKEDARAFQEQYEQRKAFFNELYVDKDSGKTIHSGVEAPFFGSGPPVKPQKGDVIDTQASYAIPLALGAFSEENKARAAQHLAAAVERRNTDDSGAVRPEYSLMTGFIGTAAIGEALSEGGRDDLAYRLLQTETYPSWLYPVVNGATTIWERLNSYTIEEGFGGNNSMNSFNHYSFGSIAAWMYNYSLGIQRDPAHPGFKHFILQPTPNPTGRMTFAKGYYDSMYGKIVSEWYTEEDGVRYQLSVPPNTTATLRLPTTAAKQVSLDGKKLRSRKGVRVVGQENGRLVVELVPGEYAFFVRE